MYGLTIMQDDHPEKSVLHFRHLNPAPDTPIGLYRFPNWRADGPLYPFVSDNRAIRPLADCLKVARNLHDISLSDFRDAGRICRKAFEFSGCLPDSEHSRREYLLALLAFATLQARRLQTRHDRRHFFLGQRAE